MKWSTAHDAKMEKSLKLFITNPTSTILKLAFFSFIFL